MNSKMEENRCLYEWLTLIAKGYCTGDFSDVFPVLAPDCVFESQWVLRPNVGYDEVTSYLTGKGKTLIKTGSFPKCAMVELVGNVNPIRNTSVIVNGGTPQSGSVGLMYTPCKPALYLEQTINGKTNNMLIDVTIDKTGMVKRIDLCMCELFRFRGFIKHMKLFPINTIGQKDDGQEHLVRVNQPYFDELYMFMPIPGLGEEEYNYYGLSFGELNIDMDIWCDALDKWRAFLDTNNIDEAYQMIADVDHDTRTIRNPEAAEYFERVGRKIWENRTNSKQMLKDLTEWTELYKNAYKYMRFESSK